MTYNSQSILEEYSKGIIDLETAILSLDKANFSEEEIKSGGIVYTPKYIADFIVQKLLPLTNESILEPSIGHGVFLFSLLDFIHENNNIQQVKKYYLSKFTGIDIQAKNIKELAQLLKIWFFKNNCDISIEECSSRLFVKDSLKENLKVDIIFGNPPYIRIQNIEDQEYRNFLRNNYKSCGKGNIDIYYAFMEYANNNSKRSSFIVPNSYIRNTGAKELRKIISHNLEKVIDFKEKKIFVGVGTYTSIFFLNQEKTNNNISILSGHNGAYSLKGLQKISFNIIKNIQFEENSVIANNDFKINKIQGSVATLRDKVFLFDGTQMLGLGGGPIDHNDSYPYLKCTKLKNKNDIISNKLRMLSPYDQVGKIKKYSSLSSSSKKYLEANKQELAKRDKGKQDKYEQWFSYGRTQGLNDKSLDLQENKKYSLIIIPGMFSKNNVFFKFKYQDIGSSYYLTSGFILEVLDEESKPLLEYLNSDDFISLCNVYGTIRPGKDHCYYSLSKKVILGILTK